MMHALRLFVKTIVAVDITNVYPLLVHPEVSSRLDQHRSFFSAWVKETKQELNMQTCWLLLALLVKRT